MGVTKKTFKTYNSLRLCKYLYNAVIVTYSVNEHFSIFLHVTMRRASGKCYAEIQKYTSET